MKCYKNRLDIELSYSQAVTSNSFLLNEDTAIRLVIFQFEIVFYFYKYWVNSIKFQNPLLSQDNVSKVAQQTNPIWILVFETI